MRAVLLVISPSSALTFTKRTVIFYLLIALHFFAAHQSLAEANNKMCKAQTLTVVGHSLYPALKPNDEILVWPSSCVEPRAGDYGVFITAANDGPVVKVIAGMPGDVLRVENASRQNNQKTIKILTINGVLAKGPNGEPYEVSLQKERMFTLYQGELKGFLLLGNENSLDSGLIGPIHSRQLVGVVPVGRIVEFNE